MVTRLKTTWTSTLRFPVTLKYRGTSTRSQERMVLVYGTLDVTYDDQSKETIQVGEYAYGPAKLPHSAYCQKGDDCVLYIGFVAPLDALPIENGEVK